VQNANPAGSAFLSEGFQTVDILCQAIL